MQICVLFENHEYICVDKPPSVLTVPARMGEGESRPILGVILEQQLNIRLWPIHRLDEPVSGAVLFAKSANAHRIANGWFEKNLIGKTYEAYSLNKVKNKPATLEKVDSRTQRTMKDAEFGGIPHTPEGIITPDMGGELVWKSKLLRGKKRAYIDAERGKLSITHAKLVLDFGKYYYWHLMPKTGRSHQLRFELYYHQYPILGDVLYGGEPWERPGIALRNLSLDFSHCSEARSLGLPMSIEAPAMERPL